MARIDKLVIAHAMQAIKQISKMARVAFVVIHAKNEQLAAYYKHLGFTRLLDDSLTLIYPVSQI